MRRKAKRGEAARCLPSEFSSSPKWTFPQDRSERQSSKLDEGTFCLEHAFKNTMYAEMPVNRSETKALSLRVTPTWQEIQDYRIFCVFKVQRDRRLSRLQVFLYAKHCYSVD